MNIMNQFFYSAKRIITDTKPIMIRLLSFIVIILILGCAFSKAFDAASLDKVKIIYHNADSGKFGELFIASMTQVEEIKSLVDFEEVSSFKKAEELIGSEQAAAFVYIPEGFSEQGGNGEKSKTVEVYREKESGVNATIVRNVVDSFVNGINTAGVIYRMTGSLDGFQMNSGSSMTEAPLSHSKSTTAMGYYAVAMLLMMLLHGAEYGRVGIGEDYLGVLGDRLRLSPIKPFDQYLGKIIGLSAVPFLQGIVIILFTKFAYGVDWGNNFTLVLLIVFTFSVLSTTFGAMLSIVTGDVAKAGSMVNIAILAFTFLAGGFVAMDFGVLANFSPSYYAKTAIFNIVYNGDLGLTYLNIVMMWAITLSLALISIVAAGRKKA